MNITAICNAWRGMASPLPPKARQRLHVREMLRAARHEATIRNAPDYSTHMERQPTNYRRARLRLVGELHRQLGTNPYDSMRGAV